MDSENFASDKSSWKKFQGYGQLAKVLLYIASMWWQDVWLIWVLISDSRTSHLQRYFYAQHWKDTPEPKRTRQWLWYFALATIENDSYYYLLATIYHWASLLAVNTPPENIALDKFPVCDGIFDFLYFHKVISSPGVQQKI